MDPPNTQEPDEDEVDDYLLRMLIAGANEIRQRLRVDEDSFYSLERVHNQRGRDHYVYAVLDEMEQLGIALNNFKEFFDNIPEDTPSDEQGRRVMRNILLTVEREQSLYVRRLIEILTELVNFSTTNSNAYFDHYLLYRELDQYKKRKSDFEHYFSIKNENTEAAIGLLKRSIAYGERSIQLARCWYLAGSSPRAGGHAALASFKDAFDRALGLATRSELAVIGFHYGDAFRYPSRGVHLNIGGVQPTVSFDSLRARRGQIVFLGLHCLLRCRRLVGMRSRTGFGPQIVRVLTNTEMARRVFNNVMRAEVAKGDFVVVFGSLCEVLDVKTSAYNYRSFEVFYLSPPPLSDDRDWSYDRDWFPALSVEKFIDGRELREGVISLFLSMGATPPSSRRIRKAMRDTALKHWLQITAPKQ